MRAPKIATGMGPYCLYALQMQLTPMLDLVLSACRSDPASAACRGNSMLNWPTSGSFVLPRAGSVNIAATIQPAPMGIGFFQIDRFAFNNILFSPARFQE